MDMNLDELMQLRLSIKAENTSLSATPRRQHIIAIQEKEVNEPMLSGSSKIHRESTSAERKLFIPRMKGVKGKGQTKKETKEALKPVDDRKVGKRKAAIKADKSSQKRAKKVEKAKKDPNKPKRPPSAFFVFLEEFRKVYKQEHPNVKAVSAVGKAGGEKWKSLSDAEKAPYEAKAAKRKSEYEKQMSAYNKKQESIVDEESDRSKSEVDEDDEETGEEEDDEDDD